MNRLNTANVKEAQGSQEEKSATTENFWFAMGKQVETKR